MAEITPNSICSDLQKEGHHLDKLKAQLQDIRHILRASLGDPTHMLNPQERRRIQQGHELLSIAVGEGSLHDLEKAQETQRQQRTRPCHTIILLGLLTIAGSLVPALWPSSARNDIAGGFSMAQYILAVGVFVVGGMLVIHSRTCSCWSGSPEADSDSSVPANFAKKLQSMGLV